MSHGVVGNAEVQLTSTVAVAPVTNWMYYDSIYTERYMSTPDVNAEGYARGAVNNVTAFQDVDFLLAHGSGDDNVHYMNSAALLDKFTQEKVRGWRFRMFTDSCVFSHARPGFMILTRLTETMRWTSEERIGRSTSG